MTAMQSKMMEMNSPAVIMAAVDKAVERATPKDEPKGKKEEDPMVKFLLGELSAMRQELRETRTTQGKSIWEQLDAIMPTIEKIAGSLGFRKGAGAPTKGDLTEVLTTVVEKVGDHIPLLVDAWSRSKDPAAAPAANGGFKLDAPKKAKTAETTTGEPSKTTASATTETAAADEPALTDEERAQLQGILNKFGTVLQQVALFMIDQYKDPDLTGFDFRDWFIRRQGIQWWADMRNECGADNLVKLIQMHAGLRGALQPKERLHGWLHEFFTPQSDGPEPIDPNAVNGQAA